MPAATFATEATAQKEALGENHQPAFEVIVLAFNDRSRRYCTFFLSGDLFVMHEGERLLFPGNTRLIQDHVFRIEND